MMDTPSTTPRLRAGFEPDEKGRPRFIEAGSLRHYRIRLSVEGAPEDTYSYYDAVREAKNRTNAFAERLKSYGDHAVRARVRTKAGRRELAVPLSRALEDTYVERGALTDAVAEAIAEIKRN